jgi:hypothetical protein
VGTSINSNDVSDCDKKTYFSLFLLWSFKF